MYHSTNEVVHEEDGCSDLGLSCDIRSETRMPRRSPFRDVAHSDLLLA